MSRFNETQFVEDFVVAGGIWLPSYEPGFYKTYDGSHLIPSEARIFSKDLANRVRSVVESNGFTNYFQAKQ